MIDTGLEKMIANWQTQIFLCRISNQKLELWNWPPWIFFHVKSSRLFGHKLAVASSPKLRHGTALVDRPTMECYQSNHGKNLTIRCGSLDFLQLFIWIHPKQCSGDLRYSIYESLSCSGSFAAFWTELELRRFHNHIDKMPPSLFCLTKSIQVQLSFIITTPKQQR